MKLTVYDSFGIAASTMPMAQAPRRRNNWHRRYLGVTTAADVILAKRLSF
jgi:hypothetical protein